MYFTFRISRPLKYAKAALENPVRAMKRNSMGYLKAPRLYEVPRSTIFDNVKGHSSIQCTMGPHTVLTAAVKRIVKWLTQMSRIGYGRTKYEPIRTVGKIDMCPVCTCNRCAQHLSRWVKCENCQTRWHYMCADRLEYELLDEKKKQRWSLFVRCVIDNMFEASDTIIRNSDAF